MLYCDKQSLLYIGHFSYLAFKLVPESHGLRLKEIESNWAEFHRAYKDSRIEEVDSNQESRKRTKAQLNM